MGFPYGKVPFAILILAVSSALGLWGMNLRRDRVEDERKPDLILATFVKEHAEAYKEILPEFEKKHGVKVQIQLVNQRALQGRLQAAMQVGADVPDMVELLNGTMGFFTSGPIEGVGFVDLTDRVHESGLYEQLVTSRFSTWTDRGRIFALPHDVHPTMLAYRRDLVEQLGIDVNELKTWDDFARVGREITRDRNGDGVIEHYMIDLPASEPWAVTLLLLQRGVEMFDQAGRCVFDDSRAVEVICWYVKQIEGKGRISFPCGWGQNLAKAIGDGLCLFYICPDWRTKQFVNDVKDVAGKMALMPLPAWEADGRRTSSWGGTGLAFTRQCRDFELAWQLAMHLYYDAPHLGPRFAQTNILPPLKSAWTQPEFAQPDPFFSGMAVGRAYADLADDIPPEVSSPYTVLANRKLIEAFSNVSLHHEKNGERGLREYAQIELTRCADQVRNVMKRNVFHAGGESE